MRGTDAQLGIDLFGDALREVGGGNFVDGNDDGAAQEASEEGGNPFGAVLAPDQDLVALADAARFKLAGEAVRRAQHFAIAPALRAISAAMDVSGLAGVAAKIVEVIQDGGASHLSQCNWSVNEVRKGTACTLQHGWKRRASKPRNYQRSLAKASAFRMNATRPSGPCLTLSVASRFARKAWTARVHPSQTW